MSSSSPLDSASRPKRPPFITINSGSGGDITTLQQAQPTSATPPSAGPSHSLLPPPPAPTGSRNASNQFSRRGPSPLPSRSPNRFIYGGSRTESSDMLLLPSRSASSMVIPYHDHPSGQTSRATSRAGSRRASFESDADPRSHNPFLSQYDTSRATSRAGSSDEEFVNTQTVSRKYNITPSDGLLLYPEDIEKDDWLHDPDVNDPDKLRCNVWNRRGLLNMGGLLFITIGILVLFIGYPILTFVREQLGLNGPTCASDPDCLSDSMPLLVNQRLSLIDPETPTSAYTKTSHDGKTLKLVFSDEFNTDGRTFYPGDDPYFEAVDLWYGATQDLEWYDPDAVTTENGTLNIKFDAFQSHNLNYRSGMVQSWNKMCFKGGRMEASIQLPGRGDTEGFWPGFWAMGNLGRPGYLSTTDGTWPYSYWDKCDLGITKNQSDTGGLSFLSGMKLPACTCSAQDHPSPGISRAAPEIDALEASVGFMGPAQYGSATGSASQSLQVAPFDIWYQPDYNYLAIYDHSETNMNVYRGGVYQEAVSGVTWLNNEWYEVNGGKFQTYGFEYKPGAEGDVSWFVGNQYTWSMDARALKPNGNIGQRIIPAEPMAVVMNLGLSNSFAQVFLPNLAALMPVTMRFDYVRIYQEEGSESVTCDPPGYPTTDYITNHPKAYNDANMTTWESAGYNWPTNSFVNGC